MITAPIELLVLTVSSSGLDGKAASRETIDTNVPVATIRISNGDGRICSESGVQVVPKYEVSYYSQCADPLHVPVEEVRSTITTDVQIAVTSGRSLVHENSELVDLLGQVELVVSPITSGESALLLLTDLQVFLV